MPEASRPGFVPGRIAAAVWVGSCAVGVACAAIIVLAAELFGAGTPLARLAELAALIALGMGLVVAVVVLRLDLWPLLRRLSGTRSRGDAVPAAQLGALALRLAAYPRRYGGILVVALSIVCPAALLATSWLHGDVVRWFAPLWPAALLCAPLAAGAAQFSAHYVLRPFLTQLPPPASASSFSARLAQVLGVLLVLPLAAASVFGLLYAVFEGARRDEVRWGAAHERAAATLAAAEGVAVSEALASSERRGGSGVGVVPRCDRCAGEVAARACEAVRNGGPGRSSGSWVDPAGDTVYAAALLPPALSGVPGVVVVWSPLPPPAGLPPWMLLVLAAALGAAWLGGRTLGRSLGGRLRVLAKAIARIGYRASAGDAVPTGSAIREIARIEGAAAAMADRAAKMRDEEEAALAALAETQRMRTQFLASVSHDLKGPLNAILGFSELLLRGVEGALGPKQREDVRIIHRGGEDLLAIINGILDSAKLEAGRVELHREWTPSVELISEAASRARGLLGEKDVTLQTQLQAGLPPVWVDPHRIGQVLSALVSNAVKFTDCGVITVRARIETTDDGRFLRVDVVDSGRGISDEDRSRVFQVFEQADSSTRRTVGGTGLGLFIARSMVELHGGSLSFESAVGQGSTFTLRLPLREDTMPGVPTNRRA